jgi:hypothetical protein
LAVQKWLADEDINRQNLGFLVQNFDASADVGGLSIIRPGRNPKYWNSDSGPWEGRTSKTIPIPQLWLNATAKAFYVAHPKWFKTAVGHDRRSRWSSTVPPMAAYVMFHEILSRGIIIRIGNQGSSVHSPMGGGKV